MYTETFEPVREAERAELQNNTAMSKDVSKVAKAIMRMTILLGLEPIGATDPGGVLLSGITIW